MFFFFWQLQIDNFSIYYFLQNLSQLLWLLVGADILLIDKSRYILSVQSHFMKLQMGIRLSKYLKSLILKFNLFLLIWLQIRMLWMGSVSFSNLKLESTMVQTWMVGSNLLTSLSNLIESSWKKKDEHHF